MVLIPEVIEAIAPVREVPVLAAGGHDALPLPLQAILSEPALRRVDALTTYWVGQGVGLMNRVQPARQVVLEFIEDYLNAAERLSNSLPH